MIFVALYKFVCLLDSWSVVDLQYVLLIEIHECSEFFLTEYQLFVYIFKNMVR